MVKMEKYNTSGFYQCAMSCCRNPAGVARYSFSSLTPIPNAALKREIPAPDPPPSITFAQPLSVLLLSEVSSAIPRFFFRRSVEFEGLVFSVNPVPRLT